MVKIKLTKILPIMLCKFSNDHFAKKKNANMIEFNEYSAD